MEEKFRAKGKKLYFGFVDLDKAFDRVLREVIRWAMHKLGAEELPVWYRNVSRLIIHLYQSAAKFCIQRSFPPLS